MLNEEYGFDLDDMERDFKIVYTDPDTGKSKKQKVELVVLKKVNHTNKSMLFVFALFKTTR